MNCQQADEHIYAFCDNTLASLLRTDLEKHLKECDLCQKKVNLTFMENEILKNPEKVPVLPEEFTKRVMKKIQDSGSTTASRSNENIGSNRNFTAKLLNTRLTPLLISAALLLALVAPGLIDLGGHLFRANNSISEDNNSISIKEGKENDRIKHLAGGTDKDTNNEMNIYNGENRNVKKYEKNEEKSASLDLPPSKQVSPAPSSGVFYLQPYNLPGSYRLAAIISDVEDNLTFVYKKAETGEEISLRISPQSKDKSEVGTAEKTAEEKSLRREAVIAGAGESTVPAPEDASSISWNINYNNDNYSVTLSGNLPSDELAQIAASIKFKEGNNDDEN